ncbi:hypothetical protein [Actinoplanes sp. ATCC 53533]|uniref:hypothetical protein n=1 Tax=Actinoplanes sp. ATCC 53533 TaxID=1288362 RepID=UPI000F78883D|nr:hypothetical protein [Actinoplanes sp. ATCC 53533]
MEARRTASQQLRSVPAYRLLTLMDAEHGASDGVAARAARQQEIAGTDQEIAVLVAQDSLPVDAELELWSGPPTEPPPDGWYGPVPLTLDCPSGELHLGSPTGAVVGLTVPAGWYDVHVYHLGRSEAEEAAETLDRELQHLSIPQRVAEFERRGGGIERYVIRLWPRR